MNEKITIKSLHQPNEIIADRYRIVTEIGQGAFGTTYEAEDLSNYKRVAMKVLSFQQTDDWKAIDLFEREAQVLATLNHPSIPKYLDYFSKDTPRDRRFYLVQELIEGESLATLVKKGWRGQEEQIRQIGLQVLDILNYLHHLSLPVIHRDIKPQNIIRRPDGQVYLVDFGAVQDVYRHTLIAGGTFVGTVGYMPPEQFRGKAFFASDLYALGATLLFLFAHRYPDELPQKRMKIDFRERVKMSPEFADWLEKMLEPALEERYKSACEAAGVLKKLYCRSSLKSKALSTTSPSQRSSQPPSSFKIVKSSIPKGTQVKIMRVERHYMSITIPQPDDSISLVSHLLMSVFFLIFFLGFWAIFNLLTASLVLLVMISFWYGILHAIIQPVCVTLELNPFTYKLHYKNAHPFVRPFSLEKNISDIQRVSLDVWVGSKESKTVKCAIESKYERYEFGNWLTPVEKQWLVKEIRDFLKNTQIFLSEDTAKIDPQNQTIAQNEGDRINLERKKKLDSLDRDVFQQTKTALQNKIISQNERDQSERERIKQARRKKLDSLDRSVFQILHPKIEYCRPISDNPEDVETPNGKVRKRPKRKHLKSHSASTRSSKTTHKKKKKKQCTRRAPNYSTTRYHRANRKHSARF